MKGAVILTASEGSFPGLADALRERAVEVLERPLIGFAAPSDWGPLDAALDRASSYRAIAFTSPRAGKAVTDRVRARGIPWPQNPGPTVWAAGQATAASLEEWLGSAHLPEGAEQESDGAAAQLARAMVAARVTGPVLFPCGDRRRDELPSVLGTAGIRVDEVVCYRTVLAQPSEARAAASEGALLVVASPSVIELLARVCPPGERPDLVAVGPTTAARARDAGWLPAAVADQPTADGVLEAITDLLARR
ncbi:MAG TPA: uroporphyrinogen-III synthase [Gemmatimonadales bacterium]|nr:uroporphyrinogen-III synthase [Gemmatimonadales bacterium]